MGQEDIRSYTVGAHSTETFGRVLCSARDHHFIVDGPVQNGCPGEAITPVEVFLSSIAACGVELIQVLAKQKSIPLQKVAVSIDGMIDRSKQTNPRYTVMNSLRAEFRMHGITREQGAELVNLFQGR